MALGEGQMRLHLALALFQQRFDIPHSPGPAGEGAGTSVVQGFEGVLLAQAELRGAMRHERIQLDEGAGIEQEVESLASRQLPPLVLPVDPNKVAELAPVVGADQPEPDLRVSWA